MTTDNIFTIFPPTQPRDNPTNLTTFMCFLSSNLWTSTYLNLSRISPKSGEKKGYKDKIQGRDIFQRVGVFHVNGVGVRKFGMSLESRENRHFGWNATGYPGENCRDVPGGAKSFRARSFCVCVCDSWPLNKINPCSCQSVVVARLFNIFAHECDEDMFAEIYKLLAPADIMKKCSNPLSGAGGFTCPCDVRGDFHIIRMTIGHQDYPMMPRDYFMESGDFNRKSIAAPLCHNVMYYFQLLSLILQF